MKEKAIESKAFLKLIANMIPVILLLFAKSIVLYTPLIASEMFLPSTKPFCSFPIILGSSF